MRYFIVDSDQYVIAVMTRENEINMSSFYEQYENNETINQTSDPKKMNR